MYGVNLFRLARLAGVRKIDIASHFDVARVQPTLWSQGKRPIPDDRIAPLVGLIAQAVKKRLAAAVPGETIEEAMATALSESVEENCQRYGYGSIESIAAYVTKLAAYDALSQRQRHRKTTLEEIERDTAFMHFWLKLQVDLLPLIRLLSGDEPSAVEDTEAQSRKVYL